MSTDGENRDSAAATRDRRRASDPPARRLEQELRAHCGIEQRERVRRSPPRPPASPAPAPARPAPPSPSARRARTCAAAGPPRRSARSGRPTPTAASARGGRTSPGRPAPARPASTSRRRASRPRRAAPAPCRCGRRAPTRRRRRRSRPRRRPPAQRAAERLGRRQRDHPAVGVPGDDHGRAVTGDGATSSAACSVGVTPACSGRSGATTSCPAARSRAGTSPHAHARAQDMWARAKIRARRARPSTKPSIARISSTTSRGTGASVVSTITAWPSLAVRRRRGRRPSGRC